MGPFSSPEAPYCRFPSSVVSAAAMAKYGRRQRGIGAISLPPRSLGPNKSYVGPSVLRRVLLMQALAHQAQQHWGRETTITFV